MLTRWTFLSPEKLHKSLFTSVIVAETTHVFCCVLPTLVTLISLAGSVSSSITLPGILLDIHEWLHAWEIPVIIFSGIMLALGWGMYFLAKQIECARPHCTPHETSCSPQKKNAHLILMIATILFVANVTIYVTIHRGMDGQGAALNTQHHSDALETH